VVGGVGQHRPLITPDQDIGGHRVVAIGRCYHDRADDARALVDADMAL